MTAPVGFFAARADGTIIYMNRSLRAVLGVGDDPALLRVKDIIKEDPARLMRRDRRGFGAVAHAHHAEGASTGRRRKRRR